MNNSKERQMISFISKITSFRLSVAQHKEKTHISFVLSLTRDEASDLMLETYLDDIKPFLGGTRNRN